MNAPNKFRGSARALACPVRRPRRTCLLTLAIAFAVAAFPLQPLRAQTTTTSKPPGAKAGNTLFVDGTNGDNTSAKRGRSDKPYRTIQAAVTAAASGDTIQVRSGSYAETVTLGNSNIAFDPGAGFVFTSGNGSLLSDGGSSVTCTITGLKVTCSGSADFRAVYLTGASSNVIVDAGDITTGSGATHAAVDVNSSGGTLRMRAQSISSGSTGLSVAAGTATVNAQSIYGTSAVTCSGGTLYLTAQELKSTADNAMVTVSGGTATVRFDKLTDTGLSTAPCLLVASGTGNFFGGIIARSTTGDGVKCTGGTLNLEVADISGSFASTDVALNQTGGTLNVGSAVHYPAGEISGTISFRNRPLVAYRSTQTSTATDATANTDLQVPVEASGVYSFEVWAPMTSASGTPDWKGGLSFPTSPTSALWTIENQDLDANATTFVSYVSGDNTSTTAQLSGSQQHVILIRGTLINGSNAGNITFAWAQNTSDATPTVGAPGARMIVQKLN